MEIDEIVDYATKSPENTNPAVLRSMLGQLSGGGSGGGGVMAITTMTTTWQEVKDALEAGKVVVYVTKNSGTDEVVGWVTVMCLITAAYQGQDGYYISGVLADYKKGAQGGPILFAETADGVLYTL